MCSSFSIIMLTVSKFLHRNSLTAHARNPEMQEEAPASICSTFCSRYVFFFLGRRVLIGLFIYFSHWNWFQSMVQWSALSWTASTWLKDTEIFITVQSHKCVRCSFLNPTLIRSVFRMPFIFFYFFQNPIKHSALGIYNLIYLFGLACPTWALPGL